MTTHRSNLAIMRGVSAGIGSCELTHVGRQPIDVDRAIAQHDAYRQMLVKLGWAVLELPAADDQPDCVFVEDVVVVLDEMAILCNPGAASRAAEVDVIAPLIERFRPTERIAAPGTVDGGDVLVVGRDIYIGRTPRTNDAGIAQFAAFAAPHGYTVQTITPTGCLHLKTACTAIDRELASLRTRTG